MDDSQKLNTDLSSASSMTRFMYLQNAVSIQSVAVSDCIIDRETATGQLQLWTWIKRLIKALNAALNSQVRLLMEPNLINSSTSSDKGWKVLRHERCGKNMQTSCTSKLQLVRAWTRDLFCKYLKIWLMGRVLQSIMTRHGASWIWFAWGHWWSRSSPKDLEQGQYRRTKYVAT